VSNDLSGCPECASRKTARQAPAAAPPAPPPRGDGHAGSAGARTRTRERGRATIAQNLAPAIARLPARAAGRLSRWAEKVDDLIKEDRHREALNTAMDVLRSEVVKLAGDEAHTEQARHLRLRAAEEMLRQAVQVAGVRAHRRSAGGGGPSERRS
jgi:hypothetical protein